MGRNRKRYNQKTMRRKIAILIILIILFTGQLVVQTYQRSKERREYLEELERLKKQEEMMTEMDAESEDTYMEEEIFSEAWEDNGPLQRDISEKEEKEILNNQEDVNGTSREN